MVKKNKLKNSLNKYFSIFKTLKIPKHDLSKSGKQPKPT